VAKSHPSRSGAELLYKTHHLIAEIFSELRPSKMQTVHFQCMDDGLKRLLAPIEAEFAKRGSSPHAVKFD
jgi:hypothetical protein